MQTLMRGSAEVLLKDTGEKIWDLDTSSTIESIPIALSSSSYFALFYKINDAAKNLTIKIATGFMKEDKLYWTDFVDLSPNAINGFTGSTSWQHTEFVVPFCTHIKFQISGSSTSTSLVIALGKQ